MILINPRSLAALNSKPISNGKVASKVDRDKNLSTHTTLNLQDIYNNPRYEEILQDTEVQQHLSQAHESYLEQQSSLKDTHPYKAEDIAHYKRTLTPTRDEGSLRDDLRGFYHYNPEHRDTLDSILTDDDKSSTKKKKSTEISLDDKRQYVQNTWKQNLEDKKGKWIQSAKDKQTLDYHQRIQDYLESLLEMKTLLDDLGEAGELFSGDLEGLKEGLDVANLGDEEYQKSLGNESDNKRGGGFDNALGTKAYSNINTIKRYLQELKDSKDLREIADLLGKLKKAEEESEIERIKELKSYSYTQTIPTKRYKEEICGVTLGRDLENLLPQELALLGDSDLELLFDLKYIQNRLFCFEKQGYHEIMKEGQEEIEKEKQKKQKEKNQGAMIICIDTSGSMSGKPEHIAKALALYLATKAQTQKRACYLISFSTSIETMELSGRGALARLMSFLSMSFNGGTDITPALKAGVQKMQSEDFKQSDLIVISDGGFGSISDSLSKQMQAQRQKNNKFYLLDVDGSSSAKKFFDTHWKYDTYSKNVKVLYNM